MRGDEVGRISRHLPVEAQVLLDKRNGKQSAYMNALEAILMSNPAYAVLYRQAVDETRAAQIVAHKFQDDVEIALARVNVEIERMLDDAVTLLDGRKAFMDKDGKAWTVDGELVDEAIAAGINWDGTQPREDYNLLLERRGRIEGLEHRGRVLSTELADNQNRLEDHNKVLSPDEIEALRGEVRDIKSEYETMGQELNLNYS